MPDIPGRNEPAGRVTVKNTLLILLALLAVTLSGCAVMENGAGRHGDAEGKAPGAAGTKSLSGVDKQELELSQKLAGAKGVSVQRQQGRICVTFQCELLFDENSNGLRDEASTQICELADILKKYPENRLKVDGFTDSTDQEQYDHELTEARASAVKDALVGKGIDPGSISARGFGDSKPVASNSTDAGRQANRRVIITIAPQ